MNANASPCLPSAFHHRTVPAQTGQGGAKRSWLDSRNQTRRLSYPGASGRRAGPAADAERRRLRYRFPLIVEAIKSLPVRSCLIDGEAIVTSGDLLVFIRGDVPAMTVLHVG